MQKYKRTSVVSPRMTESHSTMKLRRKNRNIVDDLYENISIDDLIEKKVIEKAEEIAFALLEVIPDEQISEVTGVPVDVLAEIRKEI